MAHKLKETDWRSFIWDRDSLTFAPDGLIDIDVDEAGAINSTNSKRRKGGQEINLEGEADPDNGTNPSPKVTLRPVGGGGLRYSGQLLFLRTTGGKKIKVILGGFLPPRSGRGREREQDEDTWVAVKQGG